MSKAYTPGLEISAYKTLVKTRELPIKGRAMVRLGDMIKDDFVVLSADRPGELDIIRLADRLGYDVEKVLKGTKVKVGDKVQKGDLLCEVKGLFSFFKSELRSNVDGTVEFLTESNAHLGIRQKPEKFYIYAYIPGQVIAIEEEKRVDIQTSGVFVQGIFGVGGERNGETLVLDIAEGEIVDKANLEKYKGQLVDKIIIGGMQFTLEALKFCEEEKVAGVITGSIDTRTLLAYVGYEIGVSITGDEQLPFTLIITEGFGNLAISKSITNLLRKFNNKKASINGATQIRAGAMRPEIIIAHDDKSYQQAENSDAGVLKVGSKVRVIRVPYFGMFAQVVALPSEPEKILTGAEVRIAKVRLENNQEITIPRANLELV